MLREVVVGGVGVDVVGDGLLVLSRRFRFVGGGLIGSLLMLILLSITEIYTDTDFEWLMRWKA